MYYKVCLVQVYVFGQIAEGLTLRCCGEKNNDGYTPYKGGRNWKPFVK